MGLFKADQKYLKQYIAKILQPNKATIDTHLTDRLKYPNNDDIDLHRLYEDFKEWESGGGGTKWSDEFQTDNGRPLMERFRDEIEDFIERKVRDKEYQLKDPNVKPDYDGPEFKAMSLIFSCLHCENYIHSKKSPTSVDVMARFPVSPAKNVGISHKKQLDKFHEQLLKMVGPGKVSLNDLITVLGSSDEAEAHINDLVGNSLYHIDPKIGLTDAQRQTEELTKVEHVVEAIENSNVSKGQIIAAQANDSHILVESLSEDRKSRKVPTIDYASSSDPSEETRSIILDADEVVRNAASKGVYDKVPDFIKDVEDGISPAKAAGYDSVAPAHEKVVEDRLSDKRKGKGK